LEDSEEEQVVVGQAGMEQEDLDDAQAVEEQER